MTRLHEVLEVYGGSAAYYREVKAEVGERWDQEPSDHDVVALLLEHWPGCEEADVGTDASSDEEGGLDEVDVEEEGEQQGDYQ